MTGKRKAITLFTVFFGVLVLAIAGYASRDLAVEQWYLWKLKSEDREEQRTAIQKLGEMRSASAAPKLVELFREQNTRRSFGRDDVGLREALVAIGEPAVPHLIELTQDRRQPVRSAAWTVLGEVGSIALSHLLEDLDHTDEEGRVQMLHDFGVIGAKIDEVPPKLIHACGDTSPRVRAAATAAIATVAPESRATIDTLLSALKDEDKTVRYTAAVHLGRLSDPRAKAALPELISAVMDESLDTLGRQRRVRAARLLGKHKSAAAVPALIEALNHERLVFVACWALGEIGPPARAAIPLLKRLAENRHIGQQAVRALTAIQGGDAMDDGVRSWSG